jgi:hypothetical protein
MSRTRTYSFKIKSHDIESIWLYLCTIEDAVEYMCMNVIRKTINGFMRFKQPKSVSNVQMLINTKCEIVPETRPDIVVRESLHRKDNFYEYGKYNENKHYKPEVVQSDMINITKTEFVNIIADCMVEGQKKFAQMYIPEQPIQTNNNITNNNITNNNVTINKVSFNLNMFLNEKCKDAMDITSFMKSIPIGLDEVMLFNRMGHAEAITRIIDKAYKDIDLTMRPMHCTDVKRETLYVRSDNKWTNDESKAIIEQAIDTVANRSFTNLKIWKDANPNYNYDEDKKTEYARIMRQMLGGVSDREIEENKSKIVRNVTRLAQLDKEQALTA